MSPNGLMAEEACEPSYCGCMTIYMNDSHLTSIEELKRFGEGTKGVEFEGATRREKYAWLENTLRRFGYRKLKRKEKTIVKQYGTKVTGYSDAQLTRLIGQWRRTGRLSDRTVGKRHRFSTIYTASDVALLATTDLAHNRLSGPATKKILEREYGVYGKGGYIRLKNISVSHLYNLRGRKQYTSKTKFFTKTKPTGVPIGERRKPEPYGKPGFLRVDTVHQGDKEGEKGVYHINVVDAVLQWEIVGAVEKISEAYLVPLLQDLMDQFPFVILEFHSDNGSEYINQVVARLLNKLLIQQTKSRPRHCNDNALVEGKNGAVVRKHMGYQHIAQRHAAPINTFYREHFNVYLNYHRPCGFATTTVDGKGKEKKIYNVYRTPFVALQSLPHASNFLKEGETMEKLQALALRESDNECAQKMQEQKKKLFQTFSTGSPHLGLIS